MARKKAKKVKSLKKPVKVKVPNPKKLKKSLLKLNVPKLPLLPNVAKLNPRWKMAKCLPLRK